NRLTPGTVGTLEPTIPRHKLRVEMMSPKQAIMTPLVAKLKKPVNKRPVTGKTASAANQKHVNLKLPRCNAACSPSSTPRIHIAPKLSTMAPRVGIERKKPSPKVTIDPPIKQNNQNRVRFAAR